MQATGKLVVKHGGGNPPGATLAGVGIECEGFPGTVSKFPWELPLGHGEEFQNEPADTARGLSDEAQDETVMFATDIVAEDGFLLITRVNPFGNVVKKGSKVILHSASGLDFEVPVLKQISLDGTWKSPGAHLPRSPRQTRKRQTTFRRSTFCRRARRPTMAPAGAKPPKPNVNNT